MNKRQRKKQLTHWQEQEWEYIRKLSALFEKSRIQRMSQHLLFPHPRRHWLTVQEYKNRRVAFLAELEVLEEAIRVKSLTHDYTLGGWIPKREQ